MDSLKEIDFDLLARKTTNARLRIRYLALAHFKEGKSRYQIADLLKVSRTSVNLWVSAFLEHGLTGLNEKPRSGRPFRLTKQQRALLTRYVESNAVKEGGGRLQGADIQIYILEQFGVEYELSNIYRLLDKLGFSWITSRSKHPKQSEAQQAAFKKLPTGNDQ